MPTRWKHTLTYVVPSRQRPSTPRPALLSVPVLRGNKLRDTLWYPLSGILEHASQSANVRPLFSQPGQKAAAGNHLHTQSSAAVPPTWQSALALALKAPPAWCSSVKRSHVLHHGSYSSNIQPLLPRPRCQDRKLVLVITYTWLALKQLH